MSFAVLDEIIGHTPILIDTIPIAIEIIVNVIAVCVIFDNNERINRGDINKTNITTVKNGIIFPLPSLGVDP